MRQLFTHLTLICTFASFLLPSVAAAAEFNPHLIITDSDLTAHLSMSTADIQQFLDGQRSGIRTMRFMDTDGLMKSAAEIITASALEEKINPRYILVILQKEQSLVSAQNPSQKQLDWAAGYGVCDACSMDDPSIQKFRGFAIQVRRSAGIMRYYYDNLQQNWIKRAGSTYTIDNQTVNPQSNATAFLYTYTPHIHGNKNFWKLWNQWFTKTYPDGSLLQAMNDTVVYLVQEGKKRPFSSKAALISRYNAESILTVQQTDLTAYENGAKISIPNYSLARADGWTYLLIDDMKHPIASQAVFKSLGYNPDEVEDVAVEDLASYASGTFITTASIYPLGAVVQDTKSKSLYYVKNGVRQFVPSMDIVKANFPKKKVVALDSKQLAKYPLDMKPLTFMDGVLVSTKGSSFIYVVSNGKRRHIPNETVFKNLGYQTKNIVYTDEQTLISVPEGDPIASDVITPARVATK